MVQGAIALDASARCSFCGAFGAGVPPFAGPSQPVVVTIHGAHRPELPVLLRQVDHSAVAVRPLPEGWARRRPSSVSRDPLLGVRRGRTGDTGTVTPQAPPEVERFFSLIANVPHWPKGVVPVPARIGPPAFFSASDGLWHNPDEQAVFPYGGVMVVGHNLDSEESYRARLASGESHGGEANRMPTWRNLLRSLESADIHPAECFFTNAYVGLREGQSPSGSFAGEKDPIFRAWCEQFLTEQIRVMKPRALVALGTPSRRFLAGLSPGMRSWRARKLEDVDAAGAAVLRGITIGGVSLNTAALVHPSFGQRHVGVRRYGRTGSPLEGATAEAAMLGDAASC